MSIGVCHLCGQDVALGSSFIDTGPTDSKEPTRPPSVRWVPVEEEVHGWSPFVIAHPSCYAAENGVDALILLVDESHRFMRAALQQ